MSTTATPLTTVDAETLIAAAHRAAKACTALQPNVPTAKTALQAL